jgi:hypothetical protein
MDKAFEVSPDMVIADWEVNKKLELIAAMDNRDDRDGKILRDSTVSILESLIIDVREGRTDGIVIVAIPKKLPPGCVTVCNLSLLRQGRIPEMIRALKVVLGAMLEHDLIDALTRSFFPETAKKNPQDLN